METPEIIAVEDRLVASRPSWMRTVLLLVAVALAGCWVYLQRYEVIPHPTSGEPAVYRVDRWTGRVECVLPEVVKEPG